MIHFVFNRPAQMLKVFRADGSLDRVVKASGDAWGDGYSGPHGHDYPIAPGHYTLTHVEPIQPPIASEGPGQIYVGDLDAATARVLPGATVDGVNVTLAGVTLPIGNLAKFARAEIMIHGGGSNAPDPFAPHQDLCKTEGCTRVYNADLPGLMHIVSDGLKGGQHVLFTVIGEPAPLAR